MVLEGVAGCGKMVRDGLGSARVDLSGSRTDSKACALCGKSNLTVGVCARVCVGGWSARVWAGVRGLSVRVCEGAVQGWSVRVCEGV